MIETLLCCLLAFQAEQIGAPQMLDDGTDATVWQAAPSEGVDLTVTSDGDALHLDFDFHRGGGWAAALRPLQLELPEDFRLRLRIRGRAPSNTLEVKLVEESAAGDTVWWVRRPWFTFPETWTVLDLKRRHFEFAWGPDAGRSLSRVSRLEITVSAGEGGSGDLWIDEVTLQPQERSVPSSEPPRVTASSGNPAAAFDGDPTTCWVAPPGTTWLEVRFPAAREFGGLKLDWGEGRHAVDYAVEELESGAGWTTLHEVRGGNGGRDWLFMPEGEAEALRLRLTEAASDDGFVLCEARIMPLAFSADANAFFDHVAASLPRGRFPRYFAGEQTYWTIAGVDGGEREVLVGEDGAVESAGRRFSVEPFLSIDDQVLSWADVTVEQSLVDGDLPIPVVTWHTPGLDLELTVVADDRAGADRALLRYRLANRRDSPMLARLALAVRPFQVNPRWQMLGRPGGVGRIDRIEGTADGVMVDGEPALAYISRPRAFGATTFAGGDIVEYLAAGALPPSTHVKDPLGWASGAAVYELALPNRGRADVILALPLDAEVGETPSAGDAAEQVFADALRKAAGGWRERLGRATVELPGNGADLVLTMRANLGYILVNRDGAALQPGSRAYDRSWIRDGALTSTALIRLGHVDIARQFVEWFAGYQFPSGKVPCCVDERGADPVPEHDSYGELMYSTAEVVRHSGDLEFARRIWPHVAGAAEALEALRAERRIAAEDTPERLRFWGLLPESISHEGYSNRPVHSYWDSFWAIRGLADAAWLAERLELDIKARTLEVAARQMRREVVASVARVMTEEGIGYLPGSADLADFDPTSSTVLLDPLDLARWFPARALQATFNRYVAERLESSSLQQVYTPYELRTVGAMVRLGRREEAWELLRLFLADRRPAGWRQWAEVVDPDPRGPRFVGDMPHTWVGSDFIRSFLDMLVYQDGDRLVLCAGVPQEWTRPGDRIRVAGIRTRFGELEFTVQAESGQLLMEINALTDPPPGGVVVRLPGLGDRTRATVDGAETPVVDDGVAVNALPAALVIEN